MKRVFHLLLFASAILMFVACGSRTPVNKYIKIQDDTRWDNFTNEQLKNMIKQNSAPSVVVRNISGGQTSVSVNNNADRICSILEMALARNGLDVRDRSLFDNVLNSVSSNHLQVTDYDKLYQQTRVDLLMEISSYSVNDLYKVDKYWIGNKSYYFPEETRLINGKKQKYHPTYIFRGMSITIKVIVLKDNLIGGSYSYTYVPCSAASGGALISSLSPLVYKPAAGARDINAVMEDQNNSSLIQNKNDRLDQAMENFVTNTVVPNMIADMRGEMTVSSALNQIQQLTSTSVNSQGSSVQVNDNKSDKNSWSKLKKRKDEIMDSDKLGGADLNAQSQWRQSVAEQGCIVSENSFVRVVPAISDLINMRIREQEKEKTIAKFTTDYDKFEVLSSTSKKDIDQFILTTVSNNGVISPEQSGNILFFVSQCYPLDCLTDVSILLFVDKKLVGAGSMLKGLYSEVPLDQYGKGFHNVEIFTSKGKKLFGTSANFALKANYGFKKTNALHQIELEN